MSRKSQSLSSRELLERIGLTGDTHKSLEEEPLDNLEDSENLEGDLGAALRERFLQYSHHHTFVPGDLVTWKPGLQNRR
ncbi:MAG: hypothetical protein WCP34_13185 [Pseudomonadota bacterium]